MYWNIQNSLDRHCLLNFIIGNRGGGKTYGCKKWAITDFLKYGNEFVYLRRYKPELKNIDNFFQDIEHEFPEYLFKAYQGQFFIAESSAPDDWRPFGYYITLSTSKIAKSMSFPRVSKIIFDEFILDKGVYHYLADEVTTFLEFYETVARTRDVKAYLLSNALTVTNPYFIYFDISLPYKRKIKVNKDVLIEMVQDDDYIKMKKGTRFGQLISGTAYGRYAIENEFFRDTKDFIQKKEGTAEYFFTLVFKDIEFGVWIDYKKGLLYLSEDIDKSCRISFSLTIDDHKPNTMLLKTGKSYYLEMFKRNYAIGNVRFESMKAKNMGHDIMKTIFS